MPGTIVTLYYLSGQKRQERQFFKQRFEIIRCEIVPAVWSLFQTERDCSQGLSELYD